MYLFKSGNLGFKKMSEDDRELFYQMNADPKVMRFFPSVLTRNEANELFDEMNRRIDKYGYGFFGVYLKAQNEFIGVLGLNHIGFELDEFSVHDKIEIGWRLRSNYHGQGYGKEGAQRVLDYSFKDLKIKEIFSFTACENIPSQALMKSLGLKKLGEFNHPNLKNMPLERHVLYYISK